MLLLFYGQGGVLYTLLVLLILTNLGHLLNHIVPTVFIIHCAKLEYIVNTTSVQK